MIIGTLAITGIGIPGSYIFGFAGFFSKDAIIEAAYSARGVSNAADLRLLDGHYRGADDELLQLASHLHDVSTASIAASRNISMRPMRARGICACRWCCCPSALFSPAQFSTMPL